MGTSDLELTWTEVVGNLGTYYLGLASEVVGSSVVGLSPSPVGSGARWCRKGIVGHLESWCPGS